jgi:hypothetical protein
MSLAHASWSSAVLQERPISLTLRRSNSPCCSAASPSSVVQTAERGGTCGGREGVAVSRCAQTGRARRPRTGREVVGVREQHAPGAAEVVDDLEGALVGGHLQVREVRACAREPRRHSKEVHGPLGERPAAAVRAQRHSGGRWPLSARPRWHRPGCRHIPRSLRGGRAEGGPVPLSS